MTNIGIGTWRFFLAFLVVISHLWAGMIHGPAAYAVWGFYSLSGYLMTHVLRHKYGNTTPGLQDFAYNRFLRIYPMYAIALITGAIALWFASRTGIAAKDLNPQFIWPQDPKSWFVNISLLPLPSWGLLVPVSGALAVEIGAYILMPLMAFSRPAAWLALILSLIINASYGFGTDTFAVRYSSFMTCFWVFAAGSLVSHYKKELSVLVFPKLSMLAWLAHCLVWIWYDPWPWTYGLYFSVLLSSWVIVSIESVKTSRIDSIFGDLSYPIYLFHTVIGVFILMLGLNIRSFEFFISTFIATLIVSWLLVVTIDRRINLMKRRKIVRDVPFSFEIDRAT
jgi:peptidoglycan/LPS O-acetylase OafA/YrhL